MYNSKSKGSNTSYGYPTHPAMSDNNKNKQIFGVGDLDKPSQSKCEFKKDDTSGGHMLYCPKVKR